MSGLVTHDERMISCDKLHVDMFADIRIIDAAVDLYLFILRNVLICTPDAESVPSFPCHLLRACPALKRCQGRGVALPPQREALPRSGRRSATARARLEPFMDSARALHT